MEFPVDMMTVRRWKVSALPDVHPLRFNVVRCECVMRYLSCSAL